MRGNLIRFRYINLFIGLLVIVLVCAVIFYGLSFFSTLFTFLDDTVVFTVFYLVLLLLMYYFVLHRLVEYEGTATLFDDMLILQYRFSSKDIPLCEIKSVSYWGGGVTITLFGNKRVFIFVPLKKCMRSRLPHLSRFIDGKLDSKK